jgi:hypothetical protein
MMDEFNPKKPPPPSASVGQSSLGSAALGGEPISSELEVVTVKIFGRQYRFKSNCPEFVRQIAEQVTDEIESVKKQYPSLPQEMDLAAHVAFRLAWAKTKGQQEVEELTAALIKAENGLKRLDTLIDPGLEN